MSYATQMALSSLSRPSALLNQWQGLPYFEAVAQWSHTFSQDFLNRLEKLYQSLLGSKSPSLVLGCSQEDRKKYVDPHLAKLADALPHRHLPEWNIKTILTPQVTAQARIIAAPVAFNVLAFSAVSYEHADSAPLLVATDLLENTSLHNEVREKGGAYGSGASYSPTLGQFHFYSYRDPHLARTYAAFHKAIDKIASGKFTERELEEAKLGILQTLDAPVPPGQRAHTAFSWHRTGRAYELRNAYRQAVLNTTKKEIANAVERHLKAVKDRGIFVSFAGEDLLKKEAPKLPFTLEIQPICTL
jgi:Zn-dependent M16 (insulinase) family peptidase